MARLEELGRQTAQAGKDPFTRPLGLMIGWGGWVERDEAEHPDRVTASDLYDAHQSVAGFAEPYWEASPEVQEMAVRHFVDTRLLPLLLGKVKP